MKKMILQQPLTKENFWNEMMKVFPKATTEFCQWIDEYKIAVNWNRLFAANETTDQLQSSRYKFHDIPYEMQQGIWIEFVNQTLHIYFEQPEYSYSGDLAEDIKTVFSEMEEVAEADEKIIEIIDGILNNKL